MYNNYHTHTPRCKHASGLEEEYVLSAIENGMTHLGFSDHTPYPFKVPGYHSTFRMDLDQFDDYCEKVLILKQKYKDQIDIHLGLEVEYYPELFNDLLSFISHQPIEYIIQGQHFIGNEIGEHYSGAGSSDARLLERYVKQSIEGFDTGKFTYFCHPDLFLFDGSIKDYEKWMRYLCQAARERNVILEINHLGIQTGRHYPNNIFWKIAGEEGCLAILGSDAHSPSDVFRPEIEKISLEIASQNNLELVHDLSLVCPV